MCKSTMEVKKMKISIYVAVVFEDEVSYQVMNGLRLGLKNKRRELFAEARLEKTLQSGS